MRTKLVLVIGLLLCVPVSMNAQKTVPDTLGRFFNAEGVDGTFLLYDLQTTRSTGYRPDRWDSAYIPASTFKIFNALVSLETGVIQDEQTVVAWDRIERPVAEWNRDHTLATAFPVSAVWFYQELARRVGTERMQMFLDTVGYGNRTMGGPVDMFWLDGGLRITPRQQVEFLVRLFRNDLPFALRTMALVRQIMVQEKTPLYTLRAKTGWSDAVKPEIGWYVGYVEREEGVFFFATALQIKKPRDLKARVEVTKTILRRLGLI